MPAPNSTTWIAAASRAIGETGMDVYWLGRLDGAGISGYPMREAFAWHIHLGEAHRQAADGSTTATPTPRWLDVLRAEGAPDDVIFHCFSSVRRWPAPVWRPAGS